MKNDEQNIIQTQIIGRIFLLILIFNITTAVQINSQTINNSLPTYNVIIPQNLFTQVDLNDAAAAMNVWVKKLESIIKPDFSLQPVFVNKIDDLDVNVLKKTAMICLNSIDYIKYKKKFKLEGALLSFKNDNLFTQYTLITKNNIKNIDELKGGKIGMEYKQNQIIPYMWLDILLKKNKLPAKDKFFKEVKEFNKDSQLILSLFFGQIDACVVTKNSFNLMIELNPQIQKRIKIINESPDLILTVTCFTRNFKNVDYRERILKAAKKLNSYSDGKQILTLMKSDRVVTFSDKYMYSITKLVNDYEKLQ